MGVLHMKIYQFCLSINLDPSMKKEANITQRAASDNQHFLKSKTN